MLTRRGFLGALVGGAAVAATASVARTFPFRVFSFPNEVKTYATIGEYANYVNFSSLELAVAIDAVVAKAAEELGYRCGLSFRELEKTVFDRERAILKARSLGHRYGFGKKMYLPLPKELEDLNASWSS